VARGKYRSFDISLYHKVETDDRINGSGNCIIEIRLAISSSPLVGTRSATRAPVSQPGFSSRFPGIIFVDNVSGRKFLFGFTFISAIALDIEFNFYRLAQVVEHGAMAIYRLS